MARKIETIAFSALFVLALAIPALNTNLKPNQRSDLDNRMLNELPGLSATVREASTVKTWTQLAESIERGLKDRVGFRDKMLTAYMQINNALFGIIAHPTHMRGRDGHLYYNGEEYINGYRNVYDEDRIEAAARYLARIKGFLDERDVGFFFFLIPDKKTVYPEYFPAYVNKTDAVPLIDALLGRLDALDVDYITPLGTFLSLKDEIKLYNKQYDVTHWNADGAVIGISLLLDKIHAEFPEVPPLNRSNYERAMTKANRLPQSDYRIDEDVPAYTLKNDCVKVDSEFSLEASGARDSTVCTVYDNSALEDGLTALIFCDSYLASSYRPFLQMSFKRTIFVHSANLYRLNWYFNLFSPDIVIAENVERGIDTDWDGFNKTNMAAAFFPRASSAELALDESVNVSLEDIDIAQGERVATITGKLKSTGGAVTQVYVRVGGKEYPAQVGADGRFSLALANTALEGTPDIVLTPANEEGGFRTESLELRF